MIDKNSSRRDFIKSSAILLGASIVGSSGGKSLRRPIPRRESQVLSDEQDDELTQEKLEQALPAEGFAERIDNEEENSVKLKILFGSIPENVDNFRIVATTSPFPEGNIVSTQHSEIFSVEELQKKLRNKVEEANIQPEDVEEIEDEIEDIKPVEENDDNTRTIHTEDGLAITINTEEEDDEKTEENKVETGKIQKEGGEKDIKDLNFRRFTVAFPLGVDMDIPDSKVYTSFYLVPLRKYSEDYTPSESEFLTETPPYREENGNITFYPETPGIVNLQGNEYDALQYDVEFDGGAAKLDVLSSEDNSLFTMSVGNSDFEKASDRSERWSVSVCKDAMENKYCRRIGNYCSDKVREDEGETQAFENARYMGQALPYIKDDEKNKKVHEPNYIEETLVAGAGDCVDSTAILAGLFSQEPFGYDVSLIYFENHLALGVEREKVPYEVPDEGVIDLNGKEFAYVESTAVRKAGEIGGRDLDEVIGVYHDGAWYNIDILSIFKSGIVYAQEIINTYV